MIVLYYIIFVCIFHCRKINHAISFYPIMCFPVATKCKSMKQRFLAMYMTLSNHFNNMNKLRQMPIDNRKLIILKDHGTTNSTLQGLILEPGRWFCMEKNPMSVSFLGQFHYITMLLRYFHTPKTK